MGKLDFKKQFSEFYSVPKNKMVIVDVPEMLYLAIEGKGDPNSSQEFSDAIEALYTVSYTLKFMVKKGEIGIDYGVMPLEGHWYMDEMEGFSMERKEDWKWVLMIMQPDFITDQLFEEAIAKAKTKKTLVAIDKLRLEKQKDGLSAQTLYLGPYNGEPPTIVKLHSFIKENGYRLTGKHREIYLSDARKTAPEKLRTIIRQPILKS